MRKAEGHPAAKERCRAARDKNVVPRQWTWHYYAASLIDVPLAAQLSRAMSIDMAPGAQLLCSGGMSIDVPLAAQPRFCGKE